MEKVIKYGKLMVINNNLIQLLIKYINFWKCLMVLKVYWGGALSHPITPLAQFLEHK